MGPRGERLGWVIPRDVRRFRLRPVFVPPSSQGRVGVGGGDAVSDSPSRSEYSIAAVSKLIGVSCHALRVWERRYGFPRPRRSASGRRRYSPEQVAMLRRLAKLVQAGRPVGAAIAALGAGGGCDAEPTADQSPGTELESEAAELLDRLLAQDMAGAEALFQELRDRLGDTGLVARVIEPALVEIGERWFSGDLPVAQEHFITSFLRRKLWLLLDEAQRGNPRPQHTAMVGTVQGDRHEGGILILALLLELAGWRALMMGVDLPVPEYQKAIAAWKPDILCLSFVLSRNINQRFSELASIRDVPVFLGGRSILNYQKMARRQGLFPLPGPASEVLHQLFALYDAWTRQHAPDPSGGQTPIRLGPGALM
jgi:DNA-binding transcriptional MerR regulator